MAEPTALRKARLDDDRARLRARVSHFREQLEHDRERVQDRARELTGPESTLGRHPIALVASSAGAGFVLARLPVSPVTPVKKGAGMARHGATTGLKKEAEMVLGGFAAGLLGRAADEVTGS